MKRRTSSRDDLFLSALDMYTLLSLVLIGFAYTLLSRAEQRPTIDLPAEEGRITADRKVGLTVRWQDGFDPGESAKDAKRECRILVTMPTDSGSSAGEIGREQSFTAPCLPQAFYPAAQDVNSTELAELRERFAGEDNVVSILCNARNIFQCSCLQWIMASAGFQVRAVTTGSAR